MEKMVRMIKYINKKKNVWDMRMGRHWRLVGELGPCKEKMAEGEGGLLGLEKEEKGDISLVQWPCVKLKNFCNLPHSHL